MDEKPNMTSTDNPHAFAVAMLEKAANLVGGPRRENYGNVRENFQNIADLWNSYLIGTKIMTVQAHTRALEPTDVANLLELLKIARRYSDAGRAHPDNYIDGAGYAAIAGQLAMPDKEAAP